MHGSHRSARPEAWPAFVVHRPHDGAKAELPPLLSTVALFVGSASVLTAHQAGLPPRAVAAPRDGSHGDGGGICQHGVDRTPYKGDRKISFVSYHTRAISMNIVRATAWTLHDAAQKAKGRLCGKRAGSPAALG